MKHIKEYLENVIKVKPLGQLSTREDILNDMSGEMVYIDGKCTDIFISHADYTNWLESKDEQKPFDYECASFQQKDFSPNEGPKFGIGDWIVSDLEDVNEDFRLCEIIGIEDGCYTIQSANGCKGYNFFEIWESDYHLWAIEDAKDGDVLICNDNPFLFSKYEKDEYGLVCCSYCGISANKEFVINTNAKKYWCDVEFVNPATKEQRDLLFSKMHEAGYMWDSKSKQLLSLKAEPSGGDITEEPGNKIEPFDEFAGFTDFESTLADICIDWVGKEIGWKQYIKDSAAVLLRIAIEKFNSVQDVLFEKKPALDIEIPFGAKDSELQEVTYFIPEGFHAEIRGDEVLIKKGKQKPTWSEEDEIKIKSIIAFLKSPSLCAMDGNKGIIDANIKYLKSIKSRVQPQNNIVTDKELAQAKKEAYDEALDKIEYHSGEPTFDDGWNAAIWYLKKINDRPQNGWKPSDEQMEALEHFIIHHNGSTNYAKDLEELRIQLKKL